MKRSPAFTTVTPDGSASQALTVDPEERAISPALGWDARQSGGSASLDSHRVLP